MRKPILICTADEHLCNHNPRSRTDNYLEASKVKLDFITGLADSLDVPWVSAGDLFDKAMPQPEVISTAINHIQPNKGFFTIAGNHDLKNHNYDLIKKTGVYTLASSGKKVLDPYEVIELDYFVLVGLPFGFYDVPEDVLKRLEGTNKIRVAITHILTYPSGKVPFIGCKAESAEKLSKRLNIFDLVISGDNHQRFNTDDGNTLWINCGSLMRRNTKQKDYKPKIHVVYNDLTFEEIDIPIVEGVIDDTDNVETKEKKERLESFVSSLNDVKDIGLSFVDNIKEFVGVNNINKEVNNEINKALEGEE